MKKVFSYILFVMMCSICFISTMKAEDLKCDYQFDLIESNSNENDSSLLEFSVNYNSEGLISKINDKNITNYNKVKGEWFYVTAGNEYKINISKNVTDRIAIEKATVKIRLNGKEYHDISNGCPKLSIASNSKYNGSNFEFLEIVVSKNNSNSINNASNVDELNGTTYKLGLDRCSFGERNNTNCSYVDTPKQINLSINVDREGNYKFKTNGIFETVNENMDVVWKDKSYGETILIKNSHWNGIKNIFSYQGDTTISDSSIKLYLYKTDGYIYISSEQLDDEDASGSTASGGFNIETNPKYSDLFNFSIKDNIIKSDVGFCVDYLGATSNPDSVASFLQTVYTFIKIGSIILVVVFSMLDFAGAITSDKTDVKKTAIKWVKRLIAVLIILLLPTFIDMIGNILNIEDILCGIK